ncbi:MAG: hypothetical protein JWP97_5161 [Labilithrix sp.]|nr:hypothetical protein [Labilithrix sp.]
MELRHLRYFVAVAEERHFGRAARRLRIAQPPLSRQIQGLERELGFLLFERTRRQVDLTPAGETLLVHARRIFESVELAVHEARRASHGESGRLVVAYPSTFAASGLPEVVRAFHTKFPDVELSLHELSPQQQLDALRDHEVDVAFVRGPVEDPELATELVRSEPLMAVLPSGHALAGRKILGLSLLAGEPFVLFPRVRAPAYFDFLVGLCRQAGFTPRIVQEAPQMDIVSLVAAGLGVSLVPASVRSFRRKGIVLRPLVGSPKSDLRVVWAAASRSAVLAEFLAVVRHQA